MPVVGAMIVFAGWVLPKVALGVMLLSLGVLASCVGERPGGGTWQDGISSSSQLQTQTIFVPQANGAVSAIRVSVGPKLNNGPEVQQVASEAISYYKIKGRIFGYAQVGKAACDDAKQFYQKLYGHKFLKCSMTAYSFKPKMGEPYNLYGISVSTGDESVDYELLGGNGGFHVGETISGPDLDIIHEACGQFLVWRLSVKGRRYLILRSVLNKQGKVPSNTYLARCDNA